MPWIPSLIGFLLEANQKSSNFIKKMRLKQIKNPLCKRFLPIDKEGISRNAHGTA
jgi:hypothetical protein